MGQHRANFAGPIKRKVNDFFFYVGLTYLGFMTLLEKIQSIGREFLHFTIVIWSIESSRSQS